MWRSGDMHVGRRAEITLHYFARFVRRQPTAEEKAILLHGQDNNPYEIKLARLHLEPAAAEAPSAASATPSGGEGGAKHHHGGGSSQGGSGRRLSTAETA